MPIGQHIKDEVNRIKALVVQRADMIKYRCVAAEYFSSQSLRRKKFDLLRNKGLSDDQAWSFIRLHHSDLLVDESIVDSIGRNIRWCLQQTVFEPQRYNTSEFGAYYTAKEVITAKTEREFHFKKNNPKQSMTFKMFSVEVSARLVDLRASSILKDAIQDDAYEVCQYIASELRSVCDALAAPSKRNPGGNCCPVFFSRSIACGNLVEDGEFPVEV
jgi:RES domain